MMALMTRRKALLVIAVCASGAALVGAAFMTGLSDPSQAYGADSTGPELEAQGPVTHGGLRVYLDKEGNVIPRPAGTPVPSGGARAKVIPVQKQSAVPGGGIYIDTRHIKAVSYATVNEKGEASVICVTVHGTEIGEGRASPSFAYDHSHHDALPQ